MSMVSPRREGTATYPHALWIAYQGVSRLSTLMPGAMNDEWLSSNV